LTLGSFQPRYRRSPHLIVYWNGEELVLHNYATGVAIAGSPAVVRALSALHGWRTADSVARQFAEFDPRLIARLLEELETLSMIERSDRAPSRVSRALALWEHWTPPAAFFHLATRDVPFGEPAETDAALRELARTTRSPSPLKRLKGARRVTLEAPDASGELAATLLSRRTWRRFGAEPVSRSQLATLLGLTWGVQRWASTDGQGTVALKTAPSGGARHNLEAYVLVRHVTGVPSGLYHYDPNGHALQCMRSGVPAAISTYVPNQTWYDGAACVVFMSAVFARAQWRYQYARAYRSVFLEAGHFCQTFCLVATHLGLAPFCTAAFADSRLERDLGIDGVTESAIYSCGVGTRPPGVEWAPWPHTDEVPTVHYPTCPRGRAASKRPPRKSGR
jgi:SagB-type dehydrogenase family enzyme